MLSTAREPRYQLRYLLYMTVFQLPIGGALSSMPRAWEAGMRLPVTEVGATEGPRPVAA